MSTMYLVNKDY